MGRIEKQVKSLLLQGNCQPYYREEALKLFHAIEKRLENIESGKTLVIDDTNEKEKELDEMVRYQKQLRERAEQECEYLSSVIEKMETKIDTIRKLIEKTEI